MRWDAAVTAWLAPVVADSVVTGLLGLDTEFNLAGEGDYVIPSLEYSLIVPAVPFLEVYWRTRIQLDFWTKTIADLVSLEGALIRLLHLEWPATIGTIPMWSQMIPGGGPMPGAKDGIFSRSMDFHLIYLRARYSS